MSEQLAIRPFNKQEREAFLAGVHVAVIAVERPDDAPLAVPVWYDYSPGGEVVVWTEESTKKVSLIRAAGRFTITVQDEQTNEYVSARGPVTAIEPAISGDLARIGARYSSQAGDTGGEEIADAGDGVLIRMRPERWSSMTAETTT